MTKKTSETPRNEIRCPISEGDCNATMPPYSRAPSGYVWIKMVDRYNDHHWVAVLERVKDNILRKNLPHYHWDEKEKYVKALKNYSWGSVKKDTSSDKNEDGNPRYCECRLIYILNYCKCLFEGIKRAAHNKFCGATDAPLKYCDCLFEGCMFSGFLKNVCGCNLSKVKDS